MLINLWTNPRTGSNWYCKKLALDYSKNIESYSISEMFNSNLYNIYLTENDGTIKFTKEYSKDSFYTEFALQDGKIIETHVNSERFRTVEEEESYRYSLLDYIDTEKFNVIFSNHASPISIKSFNKLKALSSENYFLSRINLQKLMESYAIAYTTKKYIQYGHSKDITLEIDIDERVYKNLAFRIKCWENLNKENGIIVYYEDIDFSEYSNLQHMPSKQYESQTVIFSENNKQIIKLLCADMKSNE